MEEILQRDDMDAVLITTGDRWHTLASLLAAKAGKDIYCEKPCSMTIEESRMLADGIARYGRVYQAGTQRRSIENFPACGAAGPQRKTGRTEGSSRQYSGAADAQRVAARRTGASRRRMRLESAGSAPAHGAPTTRTMSQGAGAASPISTAAASSSGDRTPSICASMRPDRMIRRRSSSGPTTTTLASITPIGGRRWPPQRPTSFTAGTPTASSS